MKICLIGPGIMPIPPDGWGAVESLIWDYYNILTEKGHEVHIINTPNKSQIIKECNEQRWDFIHIHYDQFYEIIPHIKDRKIGISSHYPYVDQLEKHQSDNYGHIFYYLTRNHGFHLFCDSEKDKKAFLDAGASEENMSISKLGVNFDNWVFKKECKLKDRSVYLGKIEVRKRQHLFQTLDDIDFIGKYASSDFDTSIENYLGEITPRSKLFQTLTDYASVVLLSTGENCTSLAVKEGMACGLGAVVSEYACSELDLNLPFVDVIPESKIDDLEYIREVIKKNRNTSVPLREEIRKYALEAFSWENFIEAYISNIERIK